MRTTFKLPKLGDTADDYVIVEWLVAVGDHVEAGQRLVMVETDKTEVEVPLPFDATVVELTSQIIASRTERTILHDMGADLDCPKSVASG